MNVGNLKKAMARIAITKGTEYPLPIEAHLLSMADKYLPSGDNGSAQQWSLVRQALDVRIQAERAALGIPRERGKYAYSELLHPWIKGRIDDAETQRRRGEDLMFSSQETSWDQAKTALSEAANRYAAIQKQTATVRQAIEARDQALADLPDYSRWLAHRRLATLEDGLVDEVERLWGVAHELSRKLPGQPGEQDPAALVPLTTALQDGLKRVEKKFADQRADWMSTEYVKEDWEALAAASAVAFPDDADMTLRTLMWDRFEAVRRHDESVALGAESTKPPEAAAKDAKEVSRVRTKIEGRMALAVLGQRWFSDPVFKESADFGKFADRIRKSGSEAGENGGDWRRDLAEVGQWLGQRWRRLSGEIAGLASEKNGIPNLQEFQDKLAKADYLGRLIDGGSAQLLTEVGEATGRYRETRVHDLLLWLAERAWTDHWYDESPRAPRPYYADAGSRFAKDAGKLFPQSPEVKQTLAKLAKEGRLELKGPDRLVLTSERSLDVGYKVIDQGDVPPGLPVVKPTPARDQLLDLTGSGDGYRVVPRSADRNQINLSVGSELIRGAEKNPSLLRPIARTTTLTLDGLFRGQVFDRKLAVELHPLPDQVAITAPPPGPEGFVAVRASKEIYRRFGVGTGSIAIVLDWSGSMLRPVENPKYEQAKAALREVLREVPQGTSLSVWIFSQLPAGQPAPLVNDSSEPTAGTHHHTASPASGLGSPTDRRADRTARRAEPLLRDTARPGDGEGDRNGPEGGPGNAHLACPHRWDGQSVPSGHRRRDCPVCREFLQGSESPDQHGLLYTRTR